MARPKMNQQRTEQAFSSRDDKGGNAGKDALNWALVGKSPKFYKPVEGVNVFNVIPFTVSSPNHPLVKAGSLKVGEGDFMLDLWVHQRVGPGEVDVVCPKKNYGKKCPICDQVHELYEKGDKESKDAAGKIKAKRRVWLNVQPIDKGTPQPVEVLAVSHFLFAKELLDEAGASGTVVPFADPDVGTLVRFRFVKGEKGKTFDEYKSFSFPPREEELPDKVFDEAIDFSKGIVVHDEAHLEALLYGLDDDTAPAAEESDSPPPRRTAERRAEPEDDGDEVPPRRTTRAPVEEDEAPARSARQAREEPVDDAPAGDSRCPAGHRWGADCDTKPDCRRCKVWDDCSDAKFAK